MGVGNAQNQGPSQQSPLDRGKQTTRRENTPEKPGGDVPNPEEGPGEKPDPSNGEPESPRDTDDPNRENQLGGDPPGLELADPAAAVDGTQRWGELPVHVRDIFRYEGSDGMPPEYRDWIDSYYRKLNESTRKR